MQPSSYCLFRAPVEGTRQGKTVLVQLRDVVDPETGERYTVKRYESEKAADGEIWKHETITLKPVNPNYKPIVLTSAEEGDLRVIAEMVEVLEGEQGRGLSVRTRGLSPLFWSLWSLWNPWSLYSSWFW